jgi:hypothetical protein
MRKVASEAALAGSLIKFDSEGKIRDAHAERLE